MSIRSPCYALLPPPLHPPGGKYKFLAGRFSSIPSISKDVRSMLLDCAKRLSRGANDKFKVQQPRECGQTPTANNEVVDAYNQRFGLVETLPLSTTTIHLWAVTGGVDRVKKIAAAWLCTRKVKPMVTAVTIKWIVIGMV